MTVTYDPVAMARELQWLKDNPDFNERPATIAEFLGDRYLNIEARVRPGVREALVEIFGTEIDPYRISKKRRAIFTGAIGIGKTTLASIGLPYMVHWILCLKDPQGYFGLLPGSRIAFMQMSTSEQQAREVIFGDIFARIQHSPWFMENAPYDEKYTKQIRFPNKDRFDSLTKISGLSLETRLKILSRGTTFSVASLTRWTATSKRRRRITPTSDTIRSTVVSSRGSRTGAYLF